MAIVLETTIGDLTIDLYTDQRPKSCRNFLKLCQIKYYNFSLFHSVQANFIAQSGDPTGTGSGGESLSWFTNGPHARFSQETKLPNMKHDKPGLVSMVNCGNHLIGSQFFITLAADLDSLDHHIVFGEVTEGQEILLKFNDAICDHNNRPYKDIRITHTVILEDPFEPVAGLLIPPCSPEPTREILESDRIAADEEIEDESKISEIELREIKATQEAKAQATILEIVGDIPDVDVAPPENVLFVCKLNPVTTDEDLQLIFSRFGKINSCEVIRDKKSGDSLQYAFIEFDEQKSCEDAYFKMDNVLIDDRRIHIDFSQSVAMYKWKGKGKGVEIMKPGSKRDRNQRDPNYSKENPEHTDYRRDSRRNPRRRSKSRDRKRSKSRTHDRHYHKSKRHSQSPRRRSLSRTRSSNSGSRHESSSYRKKEKERNKYRR